MCLPTVYELAFLRYWILYDESCSILKQTLARTIIEEKEVRRFKREKKKRVWSLREDQRTIRVWSVLRRGTSLTVQRAIIITSSGPENVSTLRMTNTTSNFDRFCSLFLLILL